MTIPLIQTNQPTIRLIMITVPNGVVFRKFSSIIQLIKHVGETYTAASYPPHLTLRTGAIVPTGMIQGFVEQFGEHIGQWNSFEIETDGIAREEHIKNGESDFFFYYRIKKSQALEALHRHLLTFDPFIKTRSKIFQPHLSLAYGDVSNAGHEKIKHLLKTNKQMFPKTIKWTCDNISLYYQQKLNWIPYHVFTAADFQTN